MKQYLYVIYIRVSTQSQDLEDKIQRCKLYLMNTKYVSLDDIFVIGVKCSSRSSEKKRRMNELKLRIKKNGVIVSTDISRVSRNLSEMFSLLKFFNETLNVNFYFISPSHSILNSTFEKGKSSAMVEFMYSVFGFFAQLEHEMNSERTKAGLAKARAEGKILGRKPYKDDYINKMLLSYKDEILVALSYRVTMVNLAKKYNVGIWAIRNFIDKIDPTYRKKVREERSRMKKSED